MRTPIAAAIAALFTTAPALAAETTLPEVVVTGVSANSRPMISDPQPTPKSSVTKTGLDLLGGPAQTSLYAPLDLMPSVIVESPDPYGLSPNRNINIRGKGDFHISRTIQGVPLAGIVGGTDLFDLENVEQVDVYRGGLSANQGLGVSNASGSVDQRLLAPQERFGLVGKQAFGSFGFRRTFARVDTGSLPGSGTKAFISASTSAADKWTGAGTETRDNAMLGLSQQFGERVMVDFDMVYNKFKGNSYRSMTYAQTQALKDNYSYDFNPSITGKAATDVNYYDFNRVQYKNYAALANIDVKLAEGQHFVVKPYYWKDDGVQYSASGSNVQIWNQKNDNYGAVLEYLGHYGIGTDVVAGYWLQSMEPPPPPTDQTKYTLASNGSLTYTGWATLAKIDRFSFNSPYVQVTQTLGQTVVSGGIRYMDLGAPKMQYYKTAGLPNVSYDQIWASNPALDSNAAVAVKNYREVLPNIGVRHDFGGAWSASASYGRKFGRPDWGPQASNYISNEAAFVAKGVTLQSLIDRVKPELSDQIDISARYQRGGLMIVPTVFAAKNQNRQVLVTDPALGGLTYYQGTARTTQYGVELEASYQVNSSWSIFGSGTVACETYDADTPALAGGLGLATGGKQIPNAPKTMLKGGLTYRQGELTLSPVIRYIGQRYGDSTQTQPVDGYTVADFSASYKIGRNAQLELAVLNLFDRHYVSQISPNDTNLNGATGYYAGAPRTVAVTLSAKF
jgi:iron complex outermembrane recepter protein